MFQVGARFGVYGDVVAVVAGLRPDFVVRRSVWVSGADHQSHGAVACLGRLAGPGFDGVEQGFMVDGGVGGVFAEQGGLAAQAAGLVQRVFVHFRRSGRGWRRLRILVVRQDFGKAAGVSGRRRPFL